MKPETIKAILSSKNASYAVKNQRILVTRTLDKGDYWDSETVDVTEFKLRHLLEWLNQGE